MITHKKISKAELPKLVAIAYEGDQDLFDKYHIGKMSFPESVLCTLDLIDEASRKFKLSYYKLIYKKQPIGYFVIFGEYLYSFGIGIKFRKKEVLSRWFQNVREELPPHFKTPLYDNNTRAINHLQRQGMKIIDHDKETKIVTLQN
jgi:hypothetical protein